MPCRRITTLNFNDAQPVAEKTYFFTWVPYYGVYIIHTWIYIYIYTVPYKSKSFGPQEIPGISPPSGNRLDPEPYFALRKKELKVSGFE